MKKSTKILLTSGCAVLLLVIGIIILTIGLSSNDDENPTVAENSTEVNAPVNLSNVIRYYSVNFEYPDSMTEEERDAVVLPAEALVQSGDLVYLLETPYSENYVFSGWYYDSELTLAVEASDTITENTTLYPKMREAGGEDEDTSEGSINYVSAIDVSTDYRVTVKAPSIEAVQNGISFIAVSDGNEQSDFTVEDNGDGTYTICPVADIKEGKTYQFQATDRTDSIELDGRVTADDEYVRFIHNGEVQDKEIVYYNIFTAKEEISQLRIDDEVQFINVSDVSDFDIDVAIGLYKTVITDTGNIELDENDASGTFKYTAKTLEVGDIVAIYNGQINEKEHTVTDGDVAYVEITAKNGSTYTYVSANATDIIFLPDVIPVPVGADLDDDENTITVNNSMLDFTLFEEQSILNANTKVDVDDYIALYDGELKETTEASYVKVTKVEAGSEVTVITFVPVTVDEIKNSLDTYTITGIDLTVTESEIANLENKVEEQAVDSGFAEKAAKYVLEDTITFTEDIEWGKYYTLTSEQVELLGYDPDVEAGNISWQIKINPPNVSATVTNSLKKVTQINKATGLRVAFGVTVPIGLEKVENGTRVVESYNLDLYVAFEQEVAFNTKFSVDVQWDNWAKIIWWIDEVVVNATFEMGSYTGVAAVASIYTEKYQDKSYIWDELIDGQKDKSASGLATRINAMLKDGNLSFFEGKSGTSLADEYAAMLEKNVDYVDILALKLFHSKGYMDPKTRIVNYVLDIELVLGAKLNVTMGVSFENLNVKQYSFRIKLFDGKATSNVVDKQTPYSNFNFFIMGNLGLRAGVRTTFSVGLVSVKLDNLGAMVEVGLYIDLYGFFYLHYDWNGQTNKSNLQSGGGLYAAMGIYMDIDFFGGVLLDTASFTVHLYENEWELWNSGNQLAIVAPSNDTYTWKMNSRSQQIPTSFFSMKNMDMTTGEIKKTSVSYKDFNVTVENSDKFKYDAAKGTLTVTPAQDDLALTTKVTFAYKKSDAVFSKEPLAFTVEVTWEKTEPYRNIVYMCIEEESAYYQHMGTLETVSVLEGSAITGLPKLTTERAGYDFAGWQIDCSALPEYNGKLLSQVNNLEGVNMPNATITLYPVWTPRNDVPVTVQHYVQSVDDSTKYELYKEDVVLGTPGTKLNAALMEYFMQEDGIKINYRKVPIYAKFEWEDACYVYFGIYVCGDGSTVLKLYYDREQYSISFNINNPEYAYHYDGNSVINYTFSYGEAMNSFGVEQLEIPGYTFKGWSTSADGSTGILESLPETVPYMVQKNITYYAIWDAKSTEYSVSHYIQNLDGEYDYIKTEVCTGTVGDRLSYSYLRLDDDELLSGASISNVVIRNSDGEAYKKGYLDYSGDIDVDVYYNRTFYQVYWNCQELEYYYQGQTITFPTWEKTGYTFVGWTSIFSNETEIYEPGSTIVMKDENMYFIPVFEPGNDTKYVVKHVRENHNGEYVVDSSQWCETEILTGTTDTWVKPDVKTYTGYTAPIRQTVLIAADGSTQVIYKYSKAEYRIAIKTMGGKLLGRFPATYEYGEAFYLFEDGCRPTRTGYTFKGFYIEGDESQTLITYPYWISGDMLYSEDKLTFVAVWEEAECEYRVEHYLEQLDGTFALQQTDKYMSLMNVEITANAIDFAGFTYDSSIEGSVATGMITEESSTLVLKLYYTRNSYDVNWYSYDGSTVLATTQVKYQDTITAPTDTKTDLTKVGYTFKGWSESANYGTMGINGVTVSAADYGIWEANSYTVAFDANGGVGSMTEQSFTYDELQKLSANSFTKKSHVFAGWSLTKDGNVAYADQAEVKNLATSGSLTLYAKWVEGTKVNYTVEHYLENLDGNGYTLDSSQTQTLEGTEDDEVTASSVTISGFTYDAENANNVISGTLVDGETLTLKLYYSRNSYELTFDFNGDSMKQAVTNEETGRVSITGFDIADYTVSVKYGAAIADEIAEIETGSYAGYTFGGWGTYEDTMPADDMTLTATWTPITFTVIYSPGVDWYGTVTADTDILTYTYTYGQVIEGPAVNFTNENAALCGWLLTNYEATQGSFVSFNAWPLELVYGNYSDWFTEDMFTEETGYVIYLTPFWSQSYTVVSFNGNGATGTMGDQIFENYAGGAYLIENAYIKEGYVFAGWNTAQDGSGESYEDGAYYSPTGSGGVIEVILYAQWKIIE